MNTEVNVSDSIVREPPSSIFSSLRYLGPGLILSAAIVGSGELIATTTLGAKAGFALLWVILFGCLVKVTVQVEYGRNCICHGRPTFQSWNAMGGWKPFQIHWSIYIGVLYMIATFFGQAGCLGGAAQAVVFAFPSTPIELWIGILALGIALILFKGKYEPVELIATGLNFIFVISILYCVIAVQWTPYGFSFGDFVSGFTFQLPSDSMVHALAAFGITGVAAGEITIYPYWCLEKGYAAWTGPNDGSPEWARRARGWTRVMTIDALVSMIIYTMATIAFYLLGATVLRAQGSYPEGNELILSLSQMFTQVLGEGSMTVFMICAFTVLFSTIFANTAGFSRLWTDFYGVAGWVDTGE